MQLNLYYGDCRDILRSLIERGVRVHSVVTDPPYHLESVVKRFGRDNAKGARFGKDGRFARQSRGFMGKLWDGADKDGTRIAQDPDFWRLVHDILLPGGYALAFSSPRTGHWQAAAMEIAGFILHPFVAWVYGSGFPKAHSAARAIDRALGVEGTFVPAGNPVRRLRPGADQNKTGSWEKLEDRFYQPGEYIPASVEAAAWQGWYYGGQSRKPAVEPIYVAQRPYSERNGALNILKHGVGAVNIDGCRAPSNGGRHRDGEASQNREYRERGSTNFGLKPGPRGGSPLGRWPANLIHDGSDEVVSLFPDAPGQLAASSTNPNSSKTRNVYGHYNVPQASMHPRKDSGSAARFFESYPFDGEPLIYCSKASRSDRAGSKHPTVKPIKLLQALIRHVTPPHGIVLDPFAGSGTTAEAAIREGVDCILIERDPEYVADIERRFGLWTEAHEYLERIGVL